MISSLKKAAAALLCLSVLTACGNTSEPQTSSEGTSAVTSASEASEKISETENAFGSEYDPFADDYDPYGGNGAFTQTAVHTNSSSDETEPKESEKANTEAASSDSAPDEAADLPSDISDTASAEQSSGSSSSSDGLKLEVNASNSWNDGTSDFTQLDVIITNNSKSAVDGWTVTLTAGKNASTEQSWNCNISEKNGKYTFTPVDYNSRIEPDQNTSFGIIIKNPGSIDPKKAVVTAGAFTAAASSGNNNNSSNGSSGGSSSAALDKTIPKPTTDDWLHTDGSKILDSSGKEVWLTGVNWFGYNTGTNTFDGLWTCDLDSSLDSIADHGFNLLRIPISAELIKNWSEGEYPTANFNQATNSYLVGMNSLEIFDHVIDRCRADGIKIMIDIHSANTDAGGHNANVWYTSKISEQDYLNALGWIAKRYKNDDTIIAYDLKNEPHGKAGESPRAKWDGSSDSDNWRYIAEKAAKKVLSANPNALIVVEGTEIYPKDKSKGYKSTDMNDYYCTWWGGNLRGVKDYPVDLGKYSDKLVYSPHDYGPTVYKQPWFSGTYTFDSLYKDVWYDNWFYIQKTDTAPLLIGEWGGYMTEPNLTWMKYLRRLIKENRINHTFWCFNANSGDTGGLVKDDFTTWDEEKYKFVKEVLWQQDGKFVGLDHKIPLGENGIALDDLK